jgi:hypothetical protein
MSLLRAKGALALPRFLFRITSTVEESRHDRSFCLFDRARPDIVDPRHDLGGPFVSARILQFVSKAQRDRSRDEFANVFRSKAAPDDLVMDHADTAPCECIGPREARNGEGEPA